MEIKALFTLAEDAMERALAPYSGFKVGAALLATDGCVFTGCNVENPSLTLVVCAERVALLKALSEGCTSFKAMAVVSSEDVYCYPCGLCRQMILEYAPRMEIILRQGGEVMSIRASEFLPYPFQR